MMMEDLSVLLIKEEKEAKFPKMTKEEEEPKLVQIKEVEGKPELFNFKAEEELDMHVKKEEEEEESLQIKDEEEEFSIKLEGSYGEDSGLIQGVSTSAKRLLNKIIDEDSDIQLSDSEIQEGEIEVDSEVESSAEEASTEEQGPNGPNQTSSTMEQPQDKRKFSAVWDHFDVTSENKVKCRICWTELSYLNKSTSSMLRHYRAKHENEIPDTPRINSASRKEMLDEALLNFILKDCQPLSIVESEGFMELVQVLDPSYVLPTRKTIKQMVAQKYEEERERVEMEVQQAVATTTPGALDNKMERQRRNLSGAQNRKRKREKDKDVGWMKKSLSMWLKDSKMKGKKRR